MEKTCKVVQLQNKIYFISDEEIKEGDWCYDTYSGLVQQLKIGVNDGNAIDYLRKIVASTDPSLGLPSIPENWIRDVYVPSNGSIKKVKLQTESRKSKTVPVTYNTNWVEYILKSTLNNEVVIVDEPIKKPEIADSIIFLCSYCDNKVSKRGEICQNCIDQELEEAVNEYVNKNKRFADTGKAFKAGAKWMQEKINNKIINFAKYYEHAPIKDKVHIGIEKMYEQWEKNNK